MTEQEPGLDTGLIPFPWPRCSQIPTSNNLLFLARTCSRERAAGQAFYGQRAALVLRSKLWPLPCPEPQGTLGCSGENLSVSNNTLPSPFSLPTRVQGTHPSVCERAAQVHLPSRPALFSALHRRCPLRAHQQRSSTGQGKDCNFLDPHSRYVPLTPGSAEPWLCRGPDQRPSTEVHLLSPSVHTAAIPWQS